LLSDKEFEASATCENPGDILNWTAAYWKIDPNYPRLAKLQVSILTMNFLNNPRTLSLAVVVFKYLIHF
jgi:hypothetical protein